MKRWIHSRAATFHSKVVSRHLAGIAVIALLVSGADALRAASPIAVKAQKIYVGDGRVVQNGVILIQDGKIQAIGADVAIPKGTQVIEIAKSCVTPGLIDANARIASAETVKASPTRITFDPEKESEDAQDEPVKIDTMDGENENLLPFAAGVDSGSIITEQSAEVVPHIHILNALDLHHRDFDRLVRAGVTTVYASPDASAVIGPRGAVVHTAGTMADRVLVPVGATKATIGTEPSSLGTANRTPSRFSASMYMRRPNSRMGLIWVFRKAFYDAARRRDSLPVYGADTAGPEALTVLQEVLEGRVPLRIQARIQRDILAAIRLAEEFDLEFTLEEATEAYLTIDELKATAVPVVFGPIHEKPIGIRVRSGEANESRLHTFRSLLEAGILTALSAQDLRDEDGLARQAMFAQRFGVSFDDALRAVTLTPARMLGLDEQLGTLERGKRADLVLWSGTPFAATSTPLLVLIDGDIVSDQR